MSNSHPTPIKVSPSAAVHSAATLDPDLRSQINTLLLKEGHVEKIQDALLHSLNANQTNWPTQLQSHATTLLRSGDVTTFPALLRRVLDDVRHDTLARTLEANQKTNGSKSNGTAATDATPNLAIPAAVTDDMLKTVRESLEAVCEIEESNGS
ncbi:hypothetical protein HYQ46_005348 [Verticillium longisporum]|nr:hypothetical protein HYQ46_005348 [Verticillium longisporum]